jgi:hypothetical protein
MSQKRLTLPVHRFALRPYAMTVCGVRGVATPIAEWVTCKFCLGTSK